MTDTQVKNKIARGQRIRSILSQPQYAPIRLVDEVALVAALQSGILDALPLEHIGQFRADLSAWLDCSVKSIVGAIERTGKLDEAQSNALADALVKLVSRTMAARHRDIRAGS